MKLLSLILLFVATSSSIVHRSPDDLTSLTHPLGSVSGDEGETDSSDGSSESSESTDYLLEELRNSLSQKVNEFSALSEEERRIQLAHFRGEIDLMAAKANQKLDILCVGTDDARNVLDSALELLTRGKREDVIDEDNFNALVDSDMSFEALMNSVGIREDGNDFEALIDQFLADHDRVKLVGDQFRAIKEGLKFPKLLDDLNEQKTGIINDYLKVIKAVAILLTLTSKTCDEFDAAWMRVLSDTTLLGSDLSLKFHWMVVTGQQGASQHEPNDEVYMKPLSDAIEEWKAEWIPRAHSWISQLSDLPHTTPKTEIVGALVMKSLNSNQARTDGNSLPPARLSNEGVGETSAVISKDEVEESLDFIIPVNSSPVGMSHTPEKNELVPRSFVPLKVDEAKLKSSGLMTRLIFSKKPVDVVLNEFSNDRAPSMLETRPEISQDKHFALSLKNSQRRLLRAHLNRYI